MSEIANIKKKSILFIQPSLSGVGGIEKVVPVIIKGLAEKGYSVSSATFYGNEPKNLKCVNYSNNEKRFGHFLKKPFKLIKRLFWLKSIIRKNKPGIIIVSAHGATIMVMFLKIIKCVNSPILVYEHQSLNLNDSGYRLLRNLAYRKADGFIAVSNGIKRELIKSFKDTPCVRVYNPVVSESSHTKPPDPPIFVTASRLEFVKGVDILIDLFIKYKKQGGFGELRIFGEGSLLNVLKDRVFREGQKENIKFMGVTEMLGKELGSVTAYISCARNEAFGLSLLESISSGVPIVCLDVDYGPREIMGISHSQELEYPFITPVGILYGNLNNMQGFNKSLDYVFNRNSDFIEPAVKRASYFSVDSAIKDLESLLLKLNL